MHADAEPVDSGKVVFQRRDVTPAMRQAENCRFEGAARNRRECALKS